MTSSVPAVTAGILERTLVERRDQGKKLLVPYVMAGITASWLDYVKAAQDGGADAIEIGLPFSDPMLDGETIQAASTRALANGTTTAGLLEELAGFSAAVPLTVMTYSNIARRHGYEQFTQRLTAAGVAGLIVADTPVDEVEPLLVAADASGVELVPLVAPSTAPSRMNRIAMTGRGFIYAVSTMGVTGVRSSVSGTVTDTVARIRAATSLPVLVGFGISTPDQAAAVCRVADGAVVASALMRSVLDGADATQMRDQVSALRVAVDSSAVASGHAEHRG